jgi:hypothetical protein
VTPIPHNGCRPPKRRRVYRLAVAYLHCWRAQYLACAAQFEFISGHPLPHMAVRCPQLQEVDTVNTKNWQDLDQADEAGRERWP